MKQSRGFTLIEVIVVLTTMGIAAALFASYIMGTSLTQSPVSAGLVNKQYVLIQQMEVVTSQYRQRLVNGNGTLNLSNFQTYVDNNYNGSANTVFISLHSSDNSYNTANILLVTLTNGQQTLQSIFTQ
jgi:prepilin-type N-terminal cleavage/methylation domain-containing protein